MFENVDRTIIDLQRHLADLESQASDTKNTINSLCRVSGKPILYSEAERSAAAVLGQMNGDEFYGKALTTAARMVLEARKAAGRGPAAVNEIYEAMIAGGYAFGTKNTENAKRMLREAMRKASATFHKIPSSGKVGLLEWYEAVKAKSNGKHVNGQSDDGDEGELDNGEPETAVVTATAAPKKPR